MNKLNLIQIFNDCSCMYNEDFQTTTSFSYCLRGNINSPSNFPGGKYELTGEITNIIILHSNDALLPLLTSVIC